MTKGTFGEHLRREREMRGVSLEEISTATRISTRFLNALETENWDHLPGGVFNRGFVRAVAHYLGLDEEAMLAEYAETTDDKPLVAVWATTPVKQRSAVRGMLTLVLLVAVLAAGIWLAHDLWAPWVAAWRDPAPPAPAAATSVVPSAEQETPAAAALELLELKIDIGRPTRVKVTADGEVIFDAAVNSGESRRFQARERFDVAAANSSAVLLELNGQTLPPLAAPGEPGSVTLTHKDLKKPLED